MHLLDRGISERVGFSHEGHNLGNRVFAVAELKNQSRTCIQKVHAIGFGFINHKLIINKVDFETLCSGGEIFRLKVVCHVIRL